MITLRNNTFLKKCNLTGLVNVNNVCPKKSAGDVLK